MTWTEFVAAVSEELPIEADRLGTEKLFDRSVRAAAADLQAFLPWLREGHSTVWADSFTADGMAATHAVPAGAPVIREIWLNHVEADEERPGSSNRTLLARRPWGWKDAMVIGHEQAMGCWALAPDLTTVLVAPYPMDGQTLTVVWDGVLDFGPITTPNVTLGAGWSQPGVSLAASHFVRERFAKVVDHDLALAQAHGVDYLKLRQRLYADFKERA